MNGRVVVRRLVVTLCFFCVFPIGAEEYSLTDPELRLQRIDTDSYESFLSMRLDAAGRLFVGGREALFVYEPDAEKVYGPRRELFRFPNHTWIYDIEIRGHDVYVLTLSALYVFRGLVDQRAVVSPERLLWGVPEGHVHQCFHGLAWGPDGDLYLSMGDPLWYYGDFNRPDHWGHWTFFYRPAAGELAKEWATTPYNGVGAVFRCRPDGSLFESVARGLRNSCGLVFDRHFNLFTNDNDHEGMPADYVPGRLIHVTPNTYYSWPRGWMVHKQPGRYDMLETMNTEMGRAVPVGQTYYDEAFLPERYRNNLLVARWGVRTVSRYALERRGASFQAKEQVLLVGRSQARPVGVAVGRGGRIFVTISYMAHNEGSPVYPSDLIMITRADDPPNAPFESYEAVEATPASLRSELSNPSWWRRHRAHIELQRRGDVSFARDELSSAAVSDPAMEHLLWLAADGEKLGYLTSFLSHSDARLRLQAARVLAEFDHEDPWPLLLPLLNDTDSQVRHAAVLGLFQSDEAVPAGVIHGPGRSEDSYLRHAAAMLLAEREDASRLRELCQSTDPAVRLAGVLAAGFRMTIPEVDEVLPEGFTLDSGRGRGYMLQFADARVDLRAVGPIGNYTFDYYWKTVPRTADDEALFALLVGRLEDEDEKVRVQAAHFLHVTADPRSEERVVEVRQQFQKDRLSNAPKRSISEAWIAGPFADGGEGFDRVHTPEIDVVDLTASYVDGERTVEWQHVQKLGRLYQFENLFAEVADGIDHKSFYAYFQLASFRQQLANLVLGSNDGIKVWVNQQLVSTNDVVRGALPYQDVVQIQLEPGTNDVLIRVRNETGDSGLYLNYAAFSEVAASTPEKVGAKELAARLQAAAASDGNAALSDEFLSVDWQTAVANANAQRGETLYTSLGCVKCHSPQGATAGAPSLADARSRFTIPYLVESILLPDKQISPVFRATLVVTKDGRAYTGLVVSETVDQLELLRLDTTRHGIDKRQIVQRTLQSTSPMPRGLVKTPDELRDLLSYLLKSSN